MGRVLVDVTKAGRESIIRIIAPGSAGA